MASELIVEDDAALRRVITLNLARRGYSVAEADSVASAEEMLQAAAQAGEMFDLLILDLYLPDRTGWDLLRDLARRETPAGSNGAARATPSTPRVVIITAVRGAHCRLEEFRPAGLLLKPFPIDALVRLLDRVLAGRQRVGAVDRHAPAPERRPA